MDRSGEVTLPPRRPRSSAPAAHPAISTASAAVANACLLLTTRAPLYAATGPLILKRNDTMSEDERDEFERSMQAQLIGAQGAVDAARRAVNQIDSSSSSSTASQYMSGVTEVLAARLSLAGKRYDDLRRIRVKAASLRARYRGVASTKPARELMKEVGCCDDEIPALYECCLINAQHTVSSPERDTSHILGGRSSSWRAFRRDGEHAA